MECILWDAWGYVIGDSDPDSNETEELLELNKP